MLSLLQQIFKFGLSEKWWLMPLIIFMVGIGMTLFILESTVVTQFIYTIF